MMNLPPRDDGNHWCIGELVSIEASKMLGCVPYSGGAGKNVPDEIRRARLEEGIWGWLRLGWTRVRDDGVLVHWHPEAQDWVPFSKSLHDYYTNYWVNIRHWLRDH